jgi:hypothetical protein
VRIAHDDLRRDISDRVSLIWLLITGELMTPRGTPGPLARPWVARGRPRARRVGGAPPAPRDRQQKG